MLKRLGINEIGSKRFQNEMSELFGQMKWYLVFQQIKTMRVLFFIACEG